MTEATRIIAEKKIAYVFLLQCLYIELFTCYKIYFTLQINTISGFDNLKLNIILMVGVNAKL